MQKPTLGWPMKAVHAVNANPANTILVVANMQNEFCKPGGAIFDERSPQEMAEVIHSIQGLSEQARGVGVPVIHLQSVRTLQEPEFAAYHHVPYVEHGTWGEEIIDELKPQKGDIVIQVWGLDPFYETKLEHIVKGLAEEPTSTQVIVTGGDVGGFVFHTVIGFYVRNHWTVVPVDGVYGDEECRDFSFQGRFSADSQKNIFLSRSDLISFSKVPERAVTGLVPGT